jgi:hypothetical protein
LFTLTPKGQTSKNQHRGRHLCGSIANDTTLAPAQSVWPIPQHDEWHVIGYVILPTGRANPHCTIPKTLNNPKGFERGLWRRKLRQFACVQKRSVFERLSSVKNAYWTLLYAAKNYFCS